MCDVKRCRQTETAIVYDVPELKGKKREVCNRCWFRYATKTLLLIALGVWPAPSGWRG